MISLPIKPKIVKRDGSRANFEIEALYPGYGVTVGNALRRVLLSSLEGAAVTEVRIKNVPHEFSTIAGAMEDAITISLNLKQLRFKMFSQELQKVRLSVKGEKEVLGSDFEIPTQLELVNPDCHIATLTSRSAELEIEITVEKGIGYVTQEERKKKEEPGVGVIVLDAIFTPIRKAGFRVENMRVGERTDFDKLSLEIETDGTISPEEAFRRASEILLSHFSLLTETFEQEKIEKKSEKKSQKPSPKKEKKSSSKKKKYEKTKKRKKV
ncbi:MAG: DNA-directed RNA polymerase subunit alpha [Candidatus Wildermuthbacteria bacterium]|nr:DNA-directed RNA polymerase subunit alpha [Candidatus Wildermuthbacteria bacterium]